MVLLCWSTYIKINQYIRIILNRKIKLIWDFRGPVAAKTAAHHEKHLKDYMTIENMGIQITGCTDITSMHSIAFLVIEEQHMLAIRDALKPHRGEVYHPA